MFVFAILSLLGYLCYCMHCVCEPCCPPCKKCFKCCRQEEPYTKGALAWPSIGGAIFLLVIAIVCIIGLAQSGSLHESYKTLNCAIITVLHQLTYGAVSPAKWVGISPLKDRVAVFNGDMTVFLNSISSTFGSNSWVTTGKTNLENSVATLRANTNVGGDWSYAINPLESDTTARQSVYFDTSGIFTGLADATNGVVTGAVTAIETAVNALETSANSISSDSASFSSSISDAES